MALNLMADSDAYSRQAEIYDRFSMAEDAEGKVFATLLPFVTGKNVLDLGCGAGKYLALFAPHACHITGIDAAPAQLALAQKKISGFSNVLLLEADAAELPRPPEKYDVIIATWVLGTILDTAHRDAVLQRMQQCIAPGGSIFLVENDEGGEFEDLRGRTDDPLMRTRHYNDFLQARGFAPFAHLDSHFRFGSLPEARRVFTAIWGETVGNKVQNEIIAHRVLILTKS